MKPKNINSLMSATTAMFLVLAIFPWHYGYYQFLRVLVFAASIFLFAKISHLKLQAIKSIIIIFGLIFNPFFKVTLMREIWIAINILGALFFIRLALLLKEKA